MYSESPFSTANIISAGYGDMKEHHLFWSAAGAPTDLLNNIPSDRYYYRHSQKKKASAIFRAQLLGPHDDVHGLQPQRDRP